ncbi:hypothetical protein LLEC1_01476 [Akanthomyces lecanii]|uniref:Uncharacterized protein n=1 Tax=Cordyceps confragosa TaxID=2714763 RepID=A0A179I375_CORDF|nr:hypothetical protein LLEC1_01476 [Akanthomyces lecanii]
MAPADINLSQTRRWLAQLHTTNLPPPQSASSDSSTHSSSGSADDGSSPTLASASGTGSTESSPTTTTTSPLTEARAKSLQRLCEISSAARDADTVPASSDGVNARFAPGNINYIAVSSCGWLAATNGEQGQGASSASPTTGRLSWRRRKSSGQSLEELEGGSVRRFSLSRFKLRS